MEACDCLSGFSLCVVRGCVFVFLRVFAGWVLKYINILNVLEGMIYKNLGRSSMQRMRQDCVGTRIICMNVLVLQAAPEEVDCMSTSLARILGRRFGQSILLAAQQSLQHGVLRPEH